MSELDSRLLYKCMCAMMGNWPRLINNPERKISAVFIWGRATGEFEITNYDDGVLSCARDLHRSKFCSICIPSYSGQVHDQGDTGYPGPERWRELLMTLGVPSHHIVRVPGTGHNTKTEMHDFLQFVASVGLETVIAVTQPAHALRAMLGTVQSLKVLGLESRLRVYPFWATRYDFEVECFGSQGRGPLPRLNWISEEYDRIPKYQAQGDLASLEELWKYLLFLYQGLR